VLVSQMLKSRPHHVVDIERQRPVRDAARLMAEHDIGALLVRAGDRVCGILSERDIARGVARCGMRLADAPVETLMTPNLVTCRPGDDSDALIRVMVERRIRHLPVEVDDRLVGMVSIRNIVQARLTELERERAALRDYVAGVT
jgi:CBS domain-containing protein